MKNIKKIFVVLFFMGLAFIIKGQDLHLSQFYSNPVYFNPASTGMIKDNFRVVTQSRSQWGKLSGKYLTSLASFDMPYNDRMGFGAYIVSDYASRVLNVFKFVVSGAYQITTPNNKHFLSGGLQIGFMSISINESALVFDNQWDNDNFNSDLPSGEELKNTSVYAPEANLGMYYKFLNDGKMFQPYLGFAIFHATMPKIGFVESERKRLPMRFQVIGGSDIIVNDQLTLFPEGLWMMQGNVMEILPGLRAGYKANETISFSSGVYYRDKDAIIAMIGTKYKNFTFSFSYDYNISDLSYYTNGRGAFEISLQFVPSK